jgi:L-fuculose-phosphate aldolase
MKNEEGTVRRSVVEFGRLLYERRLLTGLSGNISGRVDEEEIIITPSGACKGMLDASDLLRMRIQDGKVLSEGRPSMETPFHLEIYRGRREVGGVVHAHPLFCTILAVTGRGLRTDLTPEGLLLLGEVAFVPYATPGSEELAKKLEAVMKEHDAFILQNHGAITVGKDVAEAFFRMETLEFLAELQVRTEGVKGARPLSADEVKKILAMSSQHSEKK